MKISYLRQTLFIMLMVFMIGNVRAQSGNALNFDGVDDYVSVPDDSSLNPTAALTIEAWINTTSTADQMIVYKWDDVHQYLLDIYSNKLRFFIMTSTNSYPSVSSTTDLPLDTWVHVAAVADGNNLYLYENGTLKNTYYFGEYTIATGSGSLSIGRTGSSEYFSGTIDEVRIWNVARSQTDIQNNMNSTITSSDVQWSGLAAYYQFNQGTAGGDNSSVTQLTDNSSSGTNTGTLNNFALTGTTSNWVGTPFNVSTDSFLPVTQSSIQMNGSITSNGSYTVTTRGFCYSSTNTNPTIADSKIEETGDFSAGSYSLTATGLTPGATYYFCAYATNSLDSTVYGSVESVSLIFPMGNALSFDGTDDYVSLASNPAATATEFTVEAMVYLTAHNNWARIFDFGNAAGINMFLTTNTSNNLCPRFSINTGSGEQQLSSSTVFPLNTWTHIAVTISGTTATMYINGDQTAQNTSFAYNPDSLGATTNNYLGKSQYDDPYFCGEMDELRIWNVALTQSEIQSNMNQYLTGTETGLVAYYRFDQGDAGNDNTGLSKLNDYSNHCNTGTLNNFALTGSNSNWVSSSIEGTPIVETTSTGTPDANSTTMTGNIISIGASDITTRGFQYATDSCFTTDISSKSETGTFTSGTYSLALTGLSATTAYYVRAFSTNSEGINYGSVLVFKTLEPEVPADLAVTDSTIATGETCFDATNAITVSTVTVAEDASANFIAGYSVTLLPGFHAVEGSYVHVWITEDGSFCDADDASSLVSQPEDKSLDLDLAKEAPGFKDEIQVKVYPNPSNGQFKIAISGNTEDNPEIKVYNLLGKMVFSGNLINQATTDISISNASKGLYVMKITTGKESFSKKISIQ